jgi:hypothetical protein
MRSTFNSSGANEEKRRKRNFVLISLFIIFILVFSTLGFVMNQNTNSNGSVKEFGLTFNQINTQDEGYQWTTKINKTQYNFATLPSQSKSYAFDNSSIPLIRNAYGLIFSIDTSNNDSKYSYLLEIGKLKDAFQKNMQVAYGVTNPSDVFPKFTSGIGCGNSTTVFPVMVFSASSNETGVFMENNCIHLKAQSDFEMLQVIDGFAYRVLGVSYIEETE